MAWGDARTVAGFCHSTGRLSTVALAGTRRRGIPGEWDEKNLRENRFVSDYIVGQLDNLGIKAEVAPLGEVGYGNISHLCAEISASSTSDMIPTILDAISPTPALCGSPRPMPSTTYAIMKNTTGGVMADTLL